MNVGFTSTATLIQQRKCVSMMDKSAIFSAL